MAPRNMARFALAVLLRRRGPVVVWALVTAIFSSCLGVTGLVYIIVARQSGLVGIDLHIGPAHVVLTTVDHSVKGTTMLTVIVHPNGWQASQLRVMKGQRFAFVVGGRVNVDLSGTVALGMLRQTLEAQESRRSLRFAGSARLRQPPEDALSMGDIELLSDPKKFRPWNGPNGYDPPTAVSRARASRRALPNAPLGALIGQFRNGDCSGQATAPFFIGERAVDLEAPCSGVLWLCVNDVVFPADPDLYFEDNVGFFVVTISLQ
jgi:hypothetical protein